MHYFLDALTKTLLLGVTLALIISIIIGLCTQKGS